MAGTKKIGILLSLLLLFFFWNCASRKNPLENIQTQPSAGTPQEKAKTAETPKQETAAPSKTAISEEEKSELAKELALEEKSASQEKEDPSLFLEEAFLAYQEAQSDWEKGDLDAALNALDEAYGLIIKAQLPPDSSLLQEKNDLRLLIAQRIKEIYATRLYVIKENHKSIPVMENQYVLKEIQSFQNKERNYFIEAYRRSGLYREMILQELRNAGLPEQLSWLPLIESGFKVRALSTARALGLWQFISSTGYRYGLKRDRWIDERMDPVKSTHAAIKYLSELHEFFGDWTTALAAYNCGELRVQNVIRSQRINYLDNFWDLFANLPYETARFVPRFIAALLIINDPAKYGFELPEPYPSLKYETVVIRKPVKITSLASTLGIEASELIFLNSELRQDATPNYEYELKVPPGYQEKVLITINSLPNWIPPESTFGWHVVRRGETLSQIAARYRTSIASIARLNGLKNTRFIYPGQRLKIPGRYAPSELVSGNQVNNNQNRGNSPAPAIFAETTRYVVSPGDTLFSIAKKFGLPLEEFLKINNLTPETVIYPGQELIIKKKN